MPVSRLSPPRLLVERREPNGVHILTWEPPAEWVTFEV